MSRKLGPQFEKVISRERINAMFDAGMAYPFMTVVAAPGYGKSIAVTEYAHQSHRKVIRHNLMPIDNLPHCYWERAIEAVHSELPELAEFMRKTTFPETLGDFHFFLKNITSILFQDTEILVIYDNVENITDERILLFLNSMIAAELENLNIICVSNVRPRLGRLVGEGRHLQIGPAELQFNHSETLRLFQKFGRPIGRAECAKLVDQTGGWPLALHLMAAHPNNQAHHAFGETPHLHVIAELFHNNYFLNYDSDFQTLLIKMSFFDEVPLGLIQAAGSGDTVQIVDQMARNIFISYDYSQGCFYFQKMYHEFLKQKRALLNEADKKETYARAGRWFYENRLYFQALLCYWENRDYARYMKALAKLPQKRKSKRSIIIVLDQLSQFPEEYVRENESVNLYRALLHMNDLDIRQAHKILLALADDLESQGPPADKRLLLGNVYTALTEVSLFRNDLAALEYALKARALAPQGTTIRSNDSLVIGNIDVFFLPDSAPGRLEEMIGFIRSLSEPLQQLYHKSGRGFSELFLAEASYYAQRFNEAREYSTQAIGLAREAEQHDIVLNAYILNLRLALFQGQFDKAEAMLEKINDYSRQADVPEIYPLRDYALAMFHLWLGDSARVPSWLAAGNLSAADISMEVGRDRIIRALCRYDAGRFEAAYAVVLELDEILLEHKLWSAQVASHILKAACLHQLGNKPKAIRALRAAYELTFSNNITVCFAEFGKIMESLIDTARRQSEFDFDDQWLNDVQTAAAACARRQSAMQKLRKNEAIAARWHHDELTPRELEVMQYLANGLTRGEIGSLLGISLHGVKKHITNIYSKLGAVNRVEAIHIAQSTGLLD